MTIRMKPMDGQAHKAGPKVGNVSKRERVGFYGCAPSNRIVRVGQAQPGSQTSPRAIAVFCPACQREHTIKVMWRKATRTDLNKEPELRV